VLAGTPPQTYYPITFHYGDETVATATVRLRGKSSWVNTVKFDTTHPKMQFVIAFNQIVPKGKFHGLSTLHLSIPRDDWTFLNERIGNNWFRKIGIAAPCSNSARLNVNGSYYGLYVAEGSVNPSLVNEFWPNNRDGDLFKGGTEVQSNGTPNWPRLSMLNAATDLASLQPLVDIPNSLLEWAAEAVINDADGYYGGSHNYYIYDEGGPGYVWLPDHADSSLEWTELFTPLGYKQHPIYWWAGRPLPDPPGRDYLIVLDDPTWRRGTPTRSRRR
jgi:spore coat protein CotH